jgi:glycosyltransferase involved in cell wall biosynthesis
MTQKKPKLLIVTTVPGTIKVILKGQPAWLNQHVDASIATSPDDGIEDVREAEKLPIYEVPMYRRINPFKDIKSIWNLIKVIRYVKPDIIHSYTPKAGMIAMVSGFLARVPVRIHTFTGLIFPTATGTKKRILIAIDRLICTCATHVIPESNGVKSDLLNAEITKKPLILVGNGNVAGVDVDHFNPEIESVMKDSEAIKKRYAIPEDAFVFTFIGRFNRDKGLDELVTAFCALEQDDIWLMCAGALDKTAPPAPETVRQLETHPRIVLTGYVNDVRPVLASSDTVILPSYREGFPNVLLQASAMNTALIGTDISGSNEIIDQNVNGLIVPARDASALKDAMKQMLAKTVKERDAMGSAGRNKVIAFYEQSALRIALLEFYRSALNSKDRK